jgi:pimeloyl-ACP methyl ester carboxylesterase
MTSRRSRANLEKARIAALKQARRAPRARSRFAVGAGATIGVLAAAAVLNALLARRAERDNPPSGEFLEVDGVRLHYVERGEGDPLVLLHGNGSMIEDFASSGLVGLAAKKHRVIVFDRPGFGHSERPRTTIWTPDAQADLIRKALEKIGVASALVLGHSWGASVAVALAQRHPESVRGLVLASGYYYPSARADVLAMSLPSIPVLGDVLRYTVSPLISRLIWPLLMRKIFGPKPMPAKFRKFPKEMSLRPSQLRASAAESALMIPNAFAAERRYGDIKVPVAIVAGEDDRLIDIDDHSARLHEEIAQSTLRRVPGSGHMVHQTATKEVLAAIEEVARSRAPSAVHRAA